MPGGWYYRDPRNKPGGVAGIGQDGKLLSQLLDLSGFATLEELANYAPLSDLSGYAALDETGKVPLGLMYLGGAGGIVTYDQAAKIAMDKLYTNIANGVLKADVNAKIAETILYDWMINKIGYQVIEYSASPPTNFIAVNGGWISRASYINLYNVIGHTFCPVSIARTSTNYGTGIQCDFNYSVTELSSWPTNQPFRFGPGIGGVDLNTTYYLGNNHYEVTGTGRLRRVYTSAANAAADTNPVNIVDGGSALTFQWDSFKLPPTVSYGYLRYT